MLLGWLAVPGAAVLCWLRERRHLFSVVGLAPPVTGDDDFGPLLAGARLVLRHFVATHCRYSAEGLVIFTKLSRTIDDAHPDAHACRLKISLATMDSPMGLPWDLTTEASKFINKVAHVSATTQIEYAEEMQLLETGQVGAYTNIMRESVVGALLVGQFFVRWFILSFVRSVVRSFRRSFVRSFVRSHARTFARAQVRALVRSFVRACVRVSVPWLRVKRAIGSAGVRMPPRCGCWWCVVRLHEWLRSRKGC